MVALAKKCLNRPEVVAFDTDGHTMFMVDMPMEWVNRIGATEQEGLYVRTGIRTRFKIYKANLPFFVAGKLGIMYWPGWFRGALKFLYQKV